MCFRARLAIRRIDQHQDRLRALLSRLGIGNRLPQRLRQFVRQAVIDAAKIGHIIVEIIILEDCGAHAGLAGAHDIDIGLIEGGHEHIAVIAVLHLQIADAAAHIPDDIAFLPIGAERGDKLFIGLIDDVQGRVIGALELLFIERQQAVPPFEQIMPVLRFGRAVIDCPEMPITGVAGEFPGFAIEQEHRLVAVEQ